MAGVIGLLFAVGLYHMLSRSLLRVVVGTVLMSHGSLLMLITSGALKRGAAPVLTGEAAYTDPLPQALILTAIVIGFATTALILTLALRAYQERGSDDLEALREGDHGRR